MLSEPMSPAHRLRRRLPSARDASVSTKTRGARSEPRDTPARPASDRRFRARRWLAPAAIACATAVLLFWNLTDTYLWQDEANTAVLAVRLLEYGRPLAYDGRNLLSDDNFAAQDRQTIDERTKDP